jgi:hypothetical protein
MYFPSLFLCVSGLFLSCSRLDSCFHLYLLLSPVVWGSEPGNEAACDGGKEEIENGA